MAEEPDSEATPNRSSKLVLRIDHKNTPNLITTPASAPRTPLEGSFSALHSSDGAALRRSETSDSLSALVGGSPSLSYVGELEQLPSPMVSAGVGQAGSHLLARQRSMARTSASHSLPNSPTPIVDFARKETPLRPSSPLTGSSKPRFPSSKALAHLLNEDKNRHVSLQLSETPLGAIEIPRIRRERSQSTVHQIDPSMLQTLQKDAAKTDTKGHDPIASNQLFELKLERDTRLQRYRRLRTLGGGTFSKVELVEAEETRQLVALKVVDLEPKENIDPARLLTTIQREVEILRKMQHPLIVELMAYRMLQDRALLLLPFFPGGDLYSLASKHKEAMSHLALVKRIMAELVVAISHLHDRNIVHRDLKLENVLIRDTQESILEHIAKEEPFSSPLTALTDFGLARFIDPKAPELVTRCGSEDYAAPEIIMGQKYDGRQTDAWALGALFYSLLEGRLPFDVIPGLEHRMKGKVLHRICRIEWRWVMLRQTGEYGACWEGAKRIVTNLLRSRTKRWSVSMLLEDEWLRDEVALVQAMMKEFA